MWRLELRAADAFAATLRADQSAAIAPEHLSPVGCAGAERHHPAHQRSVRGGGGRWGGAPPHLPPPPLTLRWWAGWWRSAPAQPTGDRCSGAIAADWSARRVAANASAARSS